MNVPDPSSSTPQPLPPDPHGSGGRDPMIAAARTVLSAVMLALGVAGLYFGRDILMPLALAALLAFVLDPLVERLRHWRLSRTIAVSVVVVVTLAVVASTSAFLATQVVGLGQDLPTYQSTIQKKLRTLRMALTGRGVLDDASRVIDVVEGELDAARRALDSPAKKGTRQPLVVQVDPSPTSTLQAFQEMLAPVLAPLGFAGLVFVFLAFILLERQELRDRVLRLVGGDIHRMTDALNEAASRVTRYLNMQLGVNLGFGLSMAAGLWLIGVPGALLWGLLGSVLRFVPYLGPVVSAAFPLAVAFAVDPGWSMLIWTGALILTMELIFNNVVEPWAYGSSTGISPVAVLVSAAFWAVIWGPVGLVLATPMTVCLVVLGRHVASLRFLDVLLGSEPAYDLKTRIYQRLIGGDVEFASSLAFESIGKNSLQSFYSDVAVPMLQLAHQQPQRLVSAEHRHRVISGATALLQELREAHPAKVGSGETVLCVGGRSEHDTLAAAMLAHALALNGHPSATLPAAAVAAERIATVQLDGISAVCLSYFGAQPETHVRYVCRRLRRRRPDLRIVVALWDAPADLLSGSDAAGDLGADELVTTLDDAVQRFDAPRAATEPDAEAKRQDALHASGLTDPVHQSLLDHAAQRVAGSFNVALGAVAVIVGDKRVWCALAGESASAAQRFAIVGRDATPCEHVVLSGASLVVARAGRDPRFSGESAVQGMGLVCHAAAPLRTADGAVIGSLGCYDTQPREFDARDRKLLETMAGELMAALAAAVGSAATAKAEAPAPAPAAGSDDDSTPALGLIGPRSAPT